MVIFHLRSSNKKAEECTDRNVTIYATLMGVQLEIIHWIIAINNLRQQSKREWRNWPEFADKILFMN